MGGLGTRCVGVGLLVEGQRQDPNPGRYCGRCCDNIPFFVGSCSDETGVGNKLIVGVHLWHVPLLPVAKTVVLFSKEEEKNNNTGYRTGHGFTPTDTFRVLLSFLNWC